MPEAPFAIGISPAGNGIAVAYLTNQDAVRAVWESVPDDQRGYQQFEFTPTLTAVLNNDARGPITVVTTYVFSDGIPIQGRFQREMARRAQMEIRMSDVTNASFGNYAHMAYIGSFKVLE